MFNLKKCGFIFLLFFVSFSAQGDPLRLLMLLPTELEGAFLIPTDSAETTVELDCVSYFHNLSIEAPSDSKIFYLTRAEYKGIFDDLRSLPFVKRCLSFDESGFTIDGCRSAVSSAATETLAEGA